jgi:UDP-glucuronate 4-epimerase
MTVARWAVTGGAGFIGFHACSALLARGDEVTILDDFSDAPYPRAAKERNVADLAAAHGRRVRLLRGSVAVERDADACVEGADAVLHLAGLAGVRPSIDDPATYCRVNVEGTATVLRAALRSGAARFLFASSSSVYGNNTPLPASEEAPSTGAESPYGATKRAAELIASAMMRAARPIPCVALRFFTVYGPRQRPEMAIARFTRSLLEGRPLTVFGDGSMRRDFTHVDDVVRGILAAAERAPVGFRAYNLGSGAPVTLDELVAALARVTGRVPKMSRAPVPPGDVAATFADVARARDELGWSPRIRLDEGLATVRDWFAAGG